MENLHEMNTNVRQLLDIANTWKDVAKQINVILLVALSDSRSWYDVGNVQQGLTNNLRNVDEMLLSALSVKDLNIFVKETLPKLTFAKYLNKDEFDHLIRALTLAPSKDHF